MSSDKDEASSLESVSLFQLTFDLGRCAGWAEACGDVAEQERYEAISRAMLEGVEEGRVAMLKLVKAFAPGCYRSLKDMRCPHYMQHTMREHMVERARRHYRWVDVGNPRSFRVPEVQWSIGSLVSCAEFQSAASIAHRWGREEGHEAALRNDPSEESAAGNDALLPSTEAEARARGWCGGRSALLTLARFLSPGFESELARIESPTEMQEALHKHLVDGA